MTTLRRVLRRHGIPTNEAALQRYPQLRQSADQGYLPLELVNKIEGLADGPHCHLGIELKSIAESLLSPLSKAGLDYPRVAAYVLAYFWEEADNVADSSSCGLDDDRTMVHLLTRAYKREVEIAMLHSVRTVINDRWASVSLSA